MNKNFIFWFLVLLLSQNTFALSEQYVWRSKVYFKAQKNDADLWSKETPFDGGVTLLLKQTIIINKPIILLKDIKATIHYPCLSMIDTGPDSSYCAQYSQVSDGVNIAVNRPLIMAEAKGEMSVSGSNQIKTMNVLDAVMISDLYVDDSSFEKNLFTSATPSNFVTHVLPEIGGWGEENRNSIRLMNKDIQVVTGANIRMTIYWQLNGDHYEIENIAYPLPATFSWSLGGYGGYFEEIISKELFK